MKKFGSPPSHSRSRTVSIDKSLVPKPFTRSTYISHEIGSIVNDDDNKEDDRGITFTTEAMIVLEKRYEQS